MGLYDPELAVGTRLERVLMDVGSERMRQDLLKDQGRFEHTPADPEVNHYQRLAMLTEEVGEVAKEVLGQEEGKLANDNEVDARSLRKELVQVAAVAVAWVEGMGRPAEAICDRCGAPKGTQAIGESCNNNCGGKVVAV